MAVWRLGNRCPDNREHTSWDKHAEGCQAMGLLEKKAVSEDGHVVPAHLHEEHYDQLIPQDWRRQMLCTCSGMQACRVDYP